MIFGELESFFSLVDRAIKPFRRNQEVDTSTPELLSTRLVGVYEAHGVHRNQIPKVVGHGLTLFDVSTDELLLKKLDEKILTSTCQLFGINRDWLDGASEEVYPTYDFYKYPDKFEDFLSSLLENTCSEKLDGILLTVDKVDRGTQSVLVLQETIGSINDKEFYRYYLCNGWVSSYWKSRGYLAACVAMCWKNKIYIRGMYLDKSIVNKYAHGHNLLSFGSDGIYKLNGIPWYAEDLALVPEIYLRNVDPEERRFGLIAALSLWFQLFNQGYLETGCPVGNVESKFEEARRKIV
ncbi:hypothetical protein TUMSATVNIG1_43270 [Vibrio nigripulchritudo]|uniref:hypothetical protein n=1 Tax=Vibrio nigripulchritudo TaxID=28173 RepID=UPI001909F81E|nr:hypothetical protein [Vibrio nigripulchritudo]BCL72357.1 hypothetical protein VNTUMSATTG_42940 [Vibrio nigripulchritudo]BDU33718.1 hypothetical protein TUMSATVNIG1_43270 [Vibrio nigripulchritudo]